MHVSRRRDGICCVGMQVQAEAWHIGMPKEVINKPMGSKKRERQESQRKEDSKSQESQRISKTEVSEQNTSCQQRGIVTLQFTSRKCAKQHTDSMLRLRSVHGSSFTAAASACKQLTMHTAYLQ